jgi:hypothetical protein
MTKPIILGIALVLAVTGVSAAGINQLQGFNLALHDNLLLSGGFGSVGNIQTLAISLRQGGLPATGLSLLPAATIGRLGAAGAATDPALVPQLSRLSLVPTTNEQNSSMTYGSQSVNGVVTSSVTVTGG